MLNDGLGLLVIFKAAIGAAQMLLCLHLQVDDLAAHVNM
jgi:hypothetical protein